MPGLGSGTGGVWIMKLHGLHAAILIDRPLFPQPAIIVDEQW